MFVIDDLILAAMAAEAAGAGAAAGTAAAGTAAAGAAGSGGGLLGGATLGSGIGSMGGLLAPEAASLAGGAVPAVSSIGGVGLTAPTMSSALPFASGGAQASAPGLFGQVAETAKTAAPIMQAANFGKNMLTSQQKPAQAPAFQQPSGQGASALTQLYQQGQQYLTPLQQAQQLRQQRRQQW